MAGFLKRASLKTFQLGSFDCGLLVADWCFEITGRDPAADIRGRYTTGEEACRLVGAATLPALFNGLFRSVGVRLTRSPVYGDVAMISIGESGLRGAIITGGYVVIAAGGGISRVSPDRARRVCAWSLNA